MWFLCVVDVVLAFFYPVVVGCCWLLFVCEVVMVCIPALQGGILVCILFLAYIISFLLSPVTCIRF